MKQNMSSLVVLALWLPGCATATRGTHERVQIITNPVGAVVTSDVKLRAPETFANGTESRFAGCAPTPCSLNIARKSSPVITVSKDGYVPLNIKIVSSWATGSKSLGAGSIVAGIPPGSHAIAGEVDVLKKIPIQGAMLTSGLLTLGVAPLVDIAAGSNRSLSPNPITVFLAPEPAEDTRAEAP